MIENPDAYVPGTKMALFPGLPDAKQRADVLVFLRTKNDNPPPLPEANARGDARRRDDSPEAKPGEAAGGDAAFLELIAKADPETGRSRRRRCARCATSFDKGGGTLIGPDLYGVVGRKIASVEGFNYTPALKAHEGDWTYEKLDSWLKNPQAFAPGTVMAFPGVADDKKRAAIVAFLRTNAETPVPLPEAAAATPAAAPAAEPAAPAAETPAPPSAETPAPSAETPRHRRPRRPRPPPRHRLRPLRRRRRRRLRRLRLRLKHRHLQPPKHRHRRLRRLRPRRLRLPLKRRRLRQPRRRHRRLRHRRLRRLRRRRPRPRQRSEPAATEPVVPKPIEKVIEETEDNLPSQSSTGEPPSPNQPQPAYPEGKPEGVE